MPFTRPSANLTPIEDTVFAMVKLAKEDIAKNGEALVVDASIGSLYDEAGKLVALSSVFDHYDQIDHRTKAAYAASFSGNEDYRREVWNWLLQGRQLPLAHSVIATPGGSGAVSSTFCNILEEHQTVVLPDIAWGSYKLMASQNNLNTVCYSLFDKDHFNLASFKAACLNVLEKQDRLLVVINDPCHNPTGYSMSQAEWQQIIAFLNECSQHVPCILLNDVAYLDYGLDPKHTRDYLNCFENLSSNVLVVVAFSCSKTCTSYGLRCGAAVLIGQDPARVREAEIVYEKTARAMWSNIPNAAMENFSWVVSANREAFLKEKQQYIDLLAQRSQLFLAEAQACNLPLYPYKEGFFVTIRIEDPVLLKKVHQALIEHHIYTVQVNGGIRVGLCSLSLAKTKGLAQRIKTILDQCQKAI